MQVSNDQNDVRQTVVVGRSRRRPVRWWLGSLAASAMVPLLPLVAVAQQAAAATAVASRCQAADPSPTHNAIKLGGGVIPLLRGTGNEAIAFSFDGHTLTAYSAAGVKLWATASGEGQMFAGLDLDRDGAPDVGVARSRSLGRSCGRSVINSTWLEFYSGRTGRKIAETAPMEDMCHTALNYASPRWATNTMISGGTVVALAPQYGTTGWFFQQAKGAIRQTPFLLPTTEAFSKLYHRSDAFAADKNGNRLKVIEDSHVPNGVFLRVAGKERLVFFTSGRVLQYALSTLSASQLLGDRVFRREGTSGRNYGTVAADPQARDRVALVAGADASSVAADMIAGKAVTDPWGAIERHVTVYDVRSNQVTQRFFGTAHDDNDRGQYQNRIVAPGHILLPSTAAASHIGFNRFVDGHWMFHITRPGLPGDSLRIPDVFVWDIRDLDGDGVPEVIASPTPPAGKARMAGYLPQWTTRIYSWDAGRHLLRQRQEIADAIPWLAPTSIERGQHSSSGALYPVLSGREGDRSVMFVRRRTGELASVALAWDCEPVRQAAPVRATPPERRSRRRRADRT